MRTSIRVMRTAVGLLVVGLLLGACGQKGPLYLPDQTQPSTKPKKSAT